MPLYIVTDAGLPEPGAEVNAKLHAIAAPTAQDAAEVVLAASGQNTIDLFVIDASGVQGFHITKDFTLNVTEIEIPPAEGPPE